jgi:hypothetical protein
MTVLDAIKNRIASAGDSFEQFRGVEFEQSSLAELSPLGMSSVVTNNVAHIALIEPLRGNSQVLLIQYSSAVFIVIAYTMTDSCVVIANKQKANYTGLSTTNRLNGALPRLIAHTDCLRRRFGFAAGRGFPKHLQWPRIGGRTDEFGRAFASEQLVLLYPDRDHLFDRVDVVVFQCAS